MWKATWVAGPSPRRLISRVRGLDDDATVESFIDPVSRSWRKDLTVVLLLPIDVERVLNTPIGVSIGEDSLRWAAGSNGSFRVRDAYRIA